MKNVRHIIPLCDETLPTIRVSSILFERHWPDHKIDFLGFKEPDFDLPENHTFVSLAPVQEGGSKNWTRYIHDYVASLDEEFLIFSLDDFFPAASPDSEMVEDILSRMRNNKLIGRVCLSYDAYINCSHARLHPKDQYEFISIDKNALYRISTSPALWRRDYILKFLNHDWSPWNFEVDGSYISRYLEESILATSDPTFKRVPTRWVHKGVVSRHCPGKVNVLGLTMEDIKFLVSEGIYSEDELQWGMWAGNPQPPGFHELGGYAFHPSKMPKHAASPANWQEFYPTYEENK